MGSIQGQNLRVYFCESHRLGKVPRLGKVCRGGGGDRDGTKDAGGGRRSLDKAAGVGFLLRSTAAMRNRMFSELHD